MIAFLIAAAVSTQQQYAWTYQLGWESSNLSCAGAFAEPIANSRASAWILGYWSGLNVGAKSMVGKGIDTAGILGEVKLDCDKHPSEDLVTSVAGTWQRLQLSRKS